MDSAFSPAVIRAARNRQRRRRLLAVAVLVAGATLLWTQPWRSGPPPSAHRGTTAQATQESGLVGSWNVFAAGTDWSLAVRPGYPGRFCFSYGAPGENASGCGPAPRTENPLPPPLVIAGRFSHHERIVGLTTTRVDRVTLVMPGGRTVSARARPVPRSLRVGGYVVPVSARFGVYALDFRLAGSRLPRSTLVAHGRGGKILGRFSL